MENLMTSASEAGFTFWLFFIPFFLFVWFLPSVIALMFNRGQLKYIAAVNVPAGFSVIAWCALLVWAAGGKYGEKYLARYKKVPTAATNSAQQ
jgi:hypothetical protein